MKLKSGSSAEFSTVAVQAKKWLAADEKSKIEEKIAAFNRVAYYGAFVKKK